MVIGIAAGGCFVLIFGIVGAVMLYKYFQDKKKAEESQNWSSASGRITESYVRREESMDSEGFTTTSYYPETLYVYQFLGAEYTGDKIAFGGKVGGNQKKAQASLVQYPVGKNVIVYYDPNNPEDAVLERKMSGKGMLIIGVVFALIALCTACIGGTVAVLGLMG